MTRYIPSLDPIPSELAYYDGKRYRCHKTRCMIVNAPVEECGRMPRFDGFGNRYVPILRCQCCGSLYFGIDTLEDETPPAPPAPPARPERPQPPHQEAPAKDEGIILPNLLTV